MATYSKAPIVEAVLEFKLSRVVDATVLSLVDFVHVERGAFPAVSVRHEMTEMTQASPAGVRTMTETKMAGFELSDPQRHFIINASGELISVSNLHPYSGWEVFSARAREIWGAYGSVCPGGHAVRVGLRFVNRLDIQKGFPIQHWVKVFPAIPEGFPRQTDGFMARIGFEDGPGRKMRLTAGLAPSPVPDRIGLILDIDVSLEDGIPADENELWHEIETLRERKNEVFEASITDNTRELIR